MDQQFPMFRLATLLVRQVSAPVAKRIKEHASRHPWFSRHVCVAAGQRYHTAQLRFRMWTLALRQPRAVPPLSDAAALESGANLLGEVIVFTLGALTIIFEVNRQANKQYDKKQYIKSQWKAVFVQLEELEREVGQQQQDIDRLLVELREVAPHLFPSEPVKQQPKPPESAPDPTKHDKWSDNGASNLQSQQSDPPKTSA